MINLNVDIYKIISLIELCKLHFKFEVPFFCHYRHKNASPVSKACYLEPKPLTASNI